MSTESIFMYGSGILGPSLVGRDIDEDVTPIYQEGKTYGDEGLIRESALEIWEEEDILAVPIKVEGLERLYSNESDRGGAMVESFRKQDSSINGVLYIGIDSETKEALTKSERKGGYEKMEIKSAEITHYFSEDRVEEIEDEIPDSFEIYVPEVESEKSNLETDRLRNPTYHSRIMEGIDVHKNDWGEEVAEEFYRDFIEKTFEKDVLNREYWVSLKRNDELRAIAEMHGASI